jgi:hypothetical protein
MPQRHTAHRRLRGGTMTVMKGRNPEGRFTATLTLPIPNHYSVSEPVCPRVGSILAAGGSRFILMSQMGGGVDNGGVRKCLRKIAEKTLRYGVVFLSE